MSLIWEFSVRVAVWSAFISLEEFRIAAEKEPPMAPVILKNISYSRRVLLIPSFPP
jgi:hypothetical protein